MLQIGGACSHDVYIQHFISIIEKTSGRKHFVLLPPRLLIYLFCLNIPLLPEVPWPEPPSSLPRQRLVRAERDASAH